MKTSPMNSKEIGNSVTKVFALALMIATTSASVGQAALLTVNDPTHSTKKNTSVKTQARADGGAHNGPTTSGVSIASQTDRGIRLGDLNRTVLACQTEMLENLGDQMARGAALENRPDPTTRTGVEWMATTLNGESYSGYTSNSTQWIRSDTGEGYVWLTVQQDTGPDKKPQIYISNLGFSWGTKGKKSKEVQARVAMPLISFDDTFNDGVVDEFGNVDYTQIAVKNLKIIYPENTTDAITLKNSDTYKEMALTANLRNYYNCLVSGVQQ